jgi:hypothetical protein
MYAIADYSQPLRAIGQALETLNVQTFEMEPAGAAYLIRGAAAIEDSVTTTQRVSSENLRSTWGDIASQEPTLTREPQAKNETATSRIELNYTPKDVERLEIEGRAKRGETTNMADPSRLSQLLRCIGAYLTQKLARLLRISWAGDFLSVEYETSLGSRMQETLATSDLYDLWVRMYLQRASRLA